MLFSRINRTDPEKVFISVKAGEALLKGRPVCLHFSGTDDGKVGYLADAAPDAACVVGIADTAIASGDYGLVQCYGYRSDAVMVLGTSCGVDSFAILCVISESSGGLSMSVAAGAATAMNPMFVFANSVSKTVTATLWAGGVFIRCM
jgi:hypothetical protein